MATVEIQGQRIVRDKAEAMRVYDAVEEIAFDLETWGYPPDNALKPARGVPAVVSIAAPDLPPVVLNFGREGVTPDVVEWLNGKRLVGHNLTTFDVPYLIHRGYDPLKGPGFADTLTAEQLARTSDRRGVVEVNGTKKKTGSNKLGDTIKRRLGVDVDKDISHGGWADDELTEEQLRYAATDVRFLVPLLRSQEEQFAKIGVEKAWQSEVEIAPVVANMIGRGLPFRPGERDRHLGLAAERIAAMEEEFQSLLGMSVADVGSHLKIKKAFLERYGMKLVSSDEETMTRVSGDPGAIGRSAHLVLEARRNKKRFMYDAKWEAKYVTNGRVYPTYWPLGTDTGRFCVSPDTMVEHPRDLASTPLGTRVDELRPGQLVYSYDDDMRLVLRRVKWVGKTGVRPTVVVSAWNQRHLHFTKVRLTPDHKVCLITGEWVEAGNLKPGDRLLCMPHRTIDGGYATLHTKDGRVGEHRWVLGEVEGTPLLAGQVAHHADENPLNNDPSNLKRKTVATHMADHLSVPLDAVYRYVNTGETGGHGVKALRRHAARLGLIRRRGAYERMTDEEFVGELNKAAALGVPNDAGYPPFWGSVRDRMYRMGLVPRGHRVRFVDGRAVVVESTKGPQRNVPEPTNHVVVAVEPAGETEVWDLEVEGTHAFIGNGVTLHNSSKDPNQQQVTRDMRNMFGYEEGDDLVIVKADYSQLEIVVSAVICQEQRLVDAATTGDVHRLVASEILGVPFDEVTKDQRTMAKAGSFTLLFAGGTPSIIRLGRQYGVEISVEEARRMIRRFFQQFENVEYYIERTRATVDDKNRRGHGMILNIANGWGPRRALFGERELRATRVVNTLVQGGAAAGLKRAFVEMRKAGIADLVRATVHDEIVLECRREDAEDVAVVLEECMKQGMREIIGVKPGVEVSWDHAWS